MPNRSHEPNKHKPQSPVPPRGPAQRTAPLDKEEPELNTGEPDVAPEDDTHKERSRAAG